jgi:hypothetical protein
MIDQYTTAFPTMTKAVVDLGRRIMALDAEWHADLEVLLLEDGARQEDLWGINLFPGKGPQDFIVYESLINIRPAQQNFSMEITDGALRSKIAKVVAGLIFSGRDLKVGEPVDEYLADMRPQELSGFGSPTVYPCFKHHTQLTLEKWRSFNPHKRTLMIANEFGRANALIAANLGPDVMDCYERALELFHITIEVARTENQPADRIAGLLRLRERAAHLYARKKLDNLANQKIRDELIALDPHAYALLHSPHPPS